ncbi:MAG: PqqD family protein [Hespellia sp.]|nr:PqqD family protein [Hespellia sp.]
MKRQGQGKKENYLERKPARLGTIRWSIDDAGIVTLDVENKGIFHWLAQKLLHKPRISHIHLDEFGSFIWPLIDGQMNIIAIGVLVDERFGEKASPLYERLAKYFQVLENNHFIEWK